MRMMTSFGMGLSCFTALVAAGCGDDGAGGGGGGGAGGAGPEYRGQVSFIAMNPGPDRLVLDVYDTDGSVQTVDLGVAERVIVPAGLVEGSTLDDTPCLAPDVRPSGSSDRVGLLACAIDGDVVALAGGVSTALSQLRDAPAEGVQIAHLTRFDEQGLFFMVDPDSGESTQLWEITELDTVVPTDGELRFLPSPGAEPVTYAAAGWLEDAGFVDGARLATMATTAGASPALDFVACRLGETLDCVEVAAPE